MSATAAELPLEHPAAPAQPAQGTFSFSAQPITVLYLGTAVVLFLGMGLVGVTLRSHQAAWLPLGDTTFYMLLTLHGQGMIVAALLGTMAALWHVVQPALRPHPAPMWISYALALGGVLCVAISTLFGGFGAGWTFLYPLPFHGWWPSWSTTLFLLGDLLAGSAFGLFCLALLRQAALTYGGLSHALALPALRGQAGAHGGAPSPTSSFAAATQPAVPPPPVLVATVTSIVGLATVAGGTVIGIGLLGHLADASAGLDPLWAKNITFFFGHTLANLTIYLAAGMLYAIMPHYAQRPWSTNRVVVISWLGVLCLVMPAYFHHLYLDFVQPQALDLAGEGFTYAAVTGTLVVTIFGAMLLVWRSAFRWTLGSLLLYVGFSGWLIGGIAAALDALIPFNFHLHNTLWVPGHFHTYFILGVLLFLFGFVTHLLEEAAHDESAVSTRVWVVGPLVVGGYGLVGCWLLGGLLGLPRRYAVQAPSGAPLGGAAVVFVAILSVGLVALLAEWARLARAAGRQAGRAHLTPDEGARIHRLRRQGFRRVS